MHKVGVSHTDAKVDVRTVLMLKIQVSWDVPMHHWMSTSTDSHISENSDPQGTATLNTLLHLLGKEEMEETLSSQTPTHFYHTIWHHIPEESSIINSSKITNSVQKQTAAVDCLVLPAT